MGLLRSVCVLEREREQRDHALAVEPGVMGVGEPAVEGAAKRYVHRPRERCGGAVRYERARPGPTVDEAFVLELAIRLEHGVRIDREVLDDLACGREPVPGPKHRLANGVLDLLHELQLGRDPRSGVQVKCDAPLRDVHYDPSGLATWRRPVQAAATA